MSKIRECREKLGMTINDLARIIGVHFTTVSEWELGKISPRVNKRQVIADALKTTTEFLFGSPIAQATHSGVLTIGDLEIPCHVLEDGERILSTRGIMKSLGRTWRGRKNAGTQYPVFVEANNLKPYINEELEAVLSPKVFQPKSGHASEGFKAEILPLVCELYLKANDDGNLTSSQQKVARNCELLVRALSRVGIVALVDEATGYQEVRDRQALQKILEKFIAKELQPWIKTFPDDYYENMFRLRGWEYKPLDTSRPGVVGKYTNNLIYERLAPGVLEELRKINPMNEKGRRQHKHFQKLTPETGHPKLKEHISNVVVLMKASPDWKAFSQMVNRALPRYSDGRQLLLTAPNVLGGATDDLLEG